MNKSVLFVVAGLAAFSSLASEAGANPAPSARLAKSDKPKPAGPGPTSVDKKVKLSPDGLKFGMSLDEVSKLYEKVLDDEYVALYKTVEPGPRMAELDAELAEKKTLIVRNKLEFGNLPSGYDNTPMAGEFTYNNAESMTQIKLRSGITRHFFFFSDRLWKVYDIHKLGKKSKLGADYDGAIEGLTKTFGKAPRVRKADPAEGRSFDDADWQDKDTIVRVKNTGGNSLALAYVERKTEEGISKYRTNKGAGNEAVSKDIADITRSSAPPPEPPGAKKKK
jgi:hypothetical protein